MNQHPHRASLRKLTLCLLGTASVSAIWPPAGLGIAALYLWGLRWWPGVLLGELVVNGELFIDDSAANVAGARAVGMDAVRFTDPQALERDLTARGVI